MSISIRQYDAAATNSPVNSFPYTYLEYFVASGGVRKFVDIVAGDTLVIIVGTGPDNHVTSVVDDHGNTWQQVPNARVADSAYGKALDMWYARNVAAVVGPDVLTLTVNYDGTASTASVEIVEIAGDAIVQVSGTANGEGNPRTLSLDAGSNTAVYVAGVQASSLQSGWTYDFVNDIGGAFHRTGTGLQMVSGFYGITGAAFIAGSGGGNNNNGGNTVSLSAHSAGDVLNSDDKQSVMPDTRDKGHSFDAVVYTGTVGGLNADGSGVGWIAANAGLGDAAVPTKYSGESGHVRAHPDHFTYSPRANGDRCKFVFVRNTGDDKEALLITKI